jgi:hypothetical protein
MDNGHTQLQLTMDTHTAPIDNGHTLSHRLTTFVWQNIRYGQEMFEMIQKSKSKRVNSYNDLGGKYSEQELWIVTW